MTVDEAISEIKSRGSKEPDWLLAMVAEIERQRTIIDTIDGLFDLGQGHQAGSIDLPLRILEKAKEQ